MGTVVWIPKRDGTVQINGLSVIEKERPLLDKASKVIEGGYEELEEVKSKVSPRTYKMFKKVYTIASSCLLALVVPNTTYASSTITATSAVEHLGNTIIGGVQTLAVFVVTTMCLFDAIKAIMENEPKRIPGSAVKFAIGLFIIYAVPELFFLMRYHFETVGIVHGGPGIFNQAVPVNSGG